MSIQYGKKVMTMKEKKKKNWRDRKTAGDMVFDSINVICLLLICLVTIYPFWHLFTLSFTSGDVPLTRLYLIPPKWSLANYEKVFANQDIWTGFGNTIIRTVLGTVISVALTICTAYPLSKKYLVHRNFFTSGGADIFLDYFMLLIQDYVCTLPGSYSPVTA